MTEWSFFFGVYQLSKTLNQRNSLIKHEKNSFSGSCFRVTDFELPFAITFAADENEDDTTGESSSEDSEDSSSSWS